MFDGIAEERWLSVVGFEGAYEVSDRGQVRSLPRTKIRSTGSPHTVPGRILKWIQASHGRARVTLYDKDARPRQRFVHHLVLEAFVGPRPDGMECCHYNDDSWDNSLPNLRWDTRKSNMQDMRRNGGNANFRKTHCKWGHEFTPENTYEQASGRGCRECQRRRLRASNRKIRSRPLGKGTCKQCLKPRDLAEFKLCTPCRDRARETTRRYRKRNKGS